MTARTWSTATGFIARRPARWLWWASLVMALAGLAMSLLATAFKPDDAIVFLYLATGALGMVVAVRVPGNAVGWLLVGTGLISAMQTLATGIADLVLLEDLGPESLGVFAAAFSVAVWPMITFLPLIPVLMLFPDGTPLSRRWRIALWLSAAGILGTAVGLLFIEDPDGEEASRWGLSNPLAIDPGIADGLLAVAFMLVIVTFFAAAWSLLLRFRLSHGTERQRIKWVVYGGSLAVPLWIIGGALLDETAAGAILAGLALTLIPLSIAMAILRYRLYDIDRLISRTVSYAVVAGLLAGLYASITVGLPQVLPVSLDSPLLVAGATLAAAALFNPLRGYVRASVERRFNRSRYDAQQEIEGLAELLRSPAGLDDVKHEIIGLMARTMQPSTISIWFKASSSPAAAVSRTGSTRSEPPTR